jgi:hypothetical protein
MVPACWMYVRSDDGEAVRLSYRDGDCGLRGRLHHRSAKWAEQGLTWLLTGLLKGGINARRSRRLVFSYRRVGKVRRRIRRLVRSRVFNSARTATRNLDLPLAICDPILVPALLTSSPDSGQCMAATRRAFLHPPGIAGSRCRAARSLHGSLSSCMKLRAGCAKSSYFTAFRVVRS